MVNNWTEYKIGSIDSSNDTYADIVHLTQAQYDALENPDPDTLYSTPDNAESWEFVPENEGTPGQVVTKTTTGYKWSDINSWFKNISNCVYKWWLLTSFTADWVNYTLTYESWRLKTVSNWTKTYTATYSWWLLIWVSES